MGSYHARGKEKRSRVLHIISAFKTGQQKS